MSVQDTCGRAITSQAQRKGQGISIITAWKEEFCKDFCWKSVQESVYFSTITICFPYGSTVNLWRMCFREGKFLWTSLTFTSRKLKFCLIKLSLCLRTKQNFTSSQSLTSFSLTETHTILRQFVLFIVIDVIFSRLKISSLSWLLSLSLISLWVPLSAQKTSCKKLEALRGLTVSMWCLNITKRSKWLHEQ